MCFLSIDFPNNIRNSHWKFFFQEVFRFSRYVQTADCSGLAKGKKNLNRKCYSFLLADLKQTKSQGFNLHVNLILYCRVPFDYPMNQHPVSPEPWQQAFFFKHCKRIQSSVCQHKFSWVRPCPEISILTTPGPKFSLLQADFKLRDLPAFAFACLWIFLISWFIV